MKTPFRNTLIALSTAFILAMSVGMSSAPASAAVALITGSQNFPMPSRLIAFGDVTASSTFATTGYADVAGSSFTYTPSLNDCTTAARIAACLIEVDWSIDATKATTTTGTCGVYVNGALAATSARTIDVAAKEGTLGGVFVAANTVVGTQTIKLQCKSGDTAALTITNGHVAVKEWLPAYAH